MVDARMHEGRRITQNYAGWAAGAGLIPLPFVDMAGLMATQLAMLRRLAKLYDVPFERDQARAVLASVVGSALPRTIAVTGLPSMVKFIPVVGNVLGMIVMPAMAVAATLGVGEMFMRHFANGGTLDNAQATVLAQGVPEDAEPTSPVVEASASPEMKADRVDEPADPVADPAVAPAYNGARSARRRGAIPSLPEEE